MPSITRQAAGKRYWRSLEELADTPEFREYLEREFPSLATVAETSASRRTFMKLMGASLAMAGVTSLSGCVRWPVEKLAPHARLPDNRKPGVPVNYATSLELGGVATGLLVKSFDGRPIKVEGNREHPGSLGGTTYLHQASILALYDPDRSKRILERSPGAADQPRTWAQFQAWLAAQAGGWQAGGGAGLCILSEATSSPTVARLRAQLQQQMPKAQWFEYEPLSRDAERVGTQMAFGAPYRTFVDFAKADVVLSLGDDFLGDHPNMPAYTRAWAARRNGEGQFSRLLVIESNYSLTGSNADVRFPERPTMVGQRLAQIGAALGTHGVALDAGLKGLLSQAAPADAPAYVAELATELAAHAGKCAITVGPQQPAAVHALAALLNRALGNAPGVVSYIAEPGGTRPSHVEAIRALAGRLSAGEVETLLILGGNPAYDAPADLNFGEALAKAKHSVHLSEYDDETSALCHWHVPRAHYLEAWGDALAWDGTHTLAQPLIAPLYDGKTPAELLAAALGDAATGFDLVKATLRGKWTGADAEYDAHWERCVELGLLADSAAQRTAPPAQSNDRTLAEALSAAAADAHEIEAVFVADKLYDGRFANNAWLQELPHPMTKLTWDNAVVISPADAKRWGVNRDDLLRVTIGSQSLSLPCYVLPGHAPGAITLPLGWGRMRAGQVANGFESQTTGFDTYKLRTTAGFDIARGVKVEPAQGRYALAVTQDHHAVDTRVGHDEIQTRIPQLVREATYQQFKATPDIVRHFHHSLPMLQPFAGVDYTTKPRWGMTIDLSKCTGCSACVTACQAENNIPVVGKAEVRRGREMHWLRLDRYFSGDPESPDVEVRHQPVACVQCENAPCEQVCPVAATVHDAEGLNVMIYNRCIGTRYCSNNCPYKVRRFNWFYNHNGPYHPRSAGEWRNVDTTPLETLVFNPEVTVRSRGVMEKCTYCLQRIAAAKIVARNERREVADGEVITACQQVCPAEAINFGNLNDTASHVAREQKNPRAYAMLEFLNIRPRTLYLMGLKNPLHEPAGHGSHGAEHETEHGSEPAAHAPAAHG